jgi:hypothetical protein
MERRKVGVLTRLENGDIGNSDVEVRSLCAPPNTSERSTMEEKLLDLCVNIFAHDELGYEITLRGNGCNSSECCGTANEILHILGKSYSDIEDLVNRKMDEIEEMYG